MKQWMVVAILAALVFLAGLWIADSARQLAALQETVTLEVTEPETIPTEPVTQPTEPVTQPTEPVTQPTAPVTAPPTEEPTIPETTAPVVYTFTEEEQELLLKIGMAERGYSGCKTCIALVMRTVLNRVEMPNKFSSTIKSVIYAKDQFTPVAEGSFEYAVPNDLCREALDLICRGWDESQGALYYEWCVGPSWHSQNLNLLLQHCDVRFYN